MAILSTTNSMIPVTISKKTVSTLCECRACDRSESRHINPDENATQSKNQRQNRSDENCKNANSGKKPLDSSVLPFLVHILFR